jgi:hypothetical protein
VGSRMGSTPPGSPHRDRHRGHGIFASFASVTNSTFGRVILPNDSLAFRPSPGPVVKNGHTRPRSLRSEAV